MVAIVAPIRIGLRAKAMMAYYQQINTPATIEKTTIKIVSTIVATNSEVIPLSYTTFSAVIFVITPGARLSLSNQHICLWNIDLIRSILT